MIADKVKCNNCLAVMAVVVGTEVCPMCKTKGVLSWLDENEPEMDVFENEIVNLADYNNVINENESFLY